MHPTSKLIWDAIDSGIGDGMLAYLRVFIAQEYDRDPSIEGRLAEWLRVMSEADKLAKAEIAEEQEEQADERHCF